MKSYIIIMIATNLLLCGCTQEKNIIRNKVNNLRYVKEMPYIPELSGDSIYWSVVKEKLKVVPYLIEELDDTTETEATVPNFGGNYTVADIAFEAITEIIHGIPTKEFVEGPNELEKDGFWEYWNYTRSSYENRIKFKMRVEEWYKSNKNNLEWFEYTREFRSAPDWKYETNKHPIGGYYKLKE